MPSPAARRRPSPAPTRPGPPGAGFSLRLRRPAATGMGGRMRFPLAALLAVWVLLVGPVWGRFW
jgi:hypothetical protein